MQTAIQKLPYDSDVEPLLKRPQAVHVEIEAKGGALQDAEAPLEYPLFILQSGRQILCFGR